MGFGFPATRTLREVQVIICPVLLVLVDDITLGGLHPRQVKTLLGLEGPCRMSRRHVAASIPAGCRRIFLSQAIE